MSTNVKNKKKVWVAPVLVTVQSERPALLLLCTGQYNCVNDIGYDCCQPSVDTCFTDC